MSQLSFASGGFHGLVFAPEASFGMLPDVPQFYRFRHSSCTLEVSKDSLQSSELRDDSQISDFRLGNRKAGGDVGFEFSYGAFDMFLAAAVRGAWAGNVLKAGLTRPTFTIQRLFRDIGQYETFVGCEVDSLALKVATNAMVTGTVNFVGKDAGFSDTPLSLSPLNAGTDAPFDGFSGQLYEGGALCATITAVELNISNSLEPLHVIGNRATAGVTAKRINLTGTVSGYFANLDLLKKFLAEEESSLRLIIGDGVSRSYEIRIPRLKYSGASNPVNDESTVQISMPFQALLDNVEGSNIVMTRIPGAAVDAEAPLLTVTLPSNGATDVPLDTDVVLNFSEPVVKGSGVITLSDGGANTVAVPVEDGRVAVYGQRVTISPGAPLQAGTTYVVTVSDGALLDAAGNAFAGIDDPAVLSFTTVA